MEADQSCVLFWVGKVTVDGQMADVLQVGLRGEMKVLLGIAVCDDEEVLDRPVATVSGGLHLLRFVVDLPADEQRVLVRWYLIRLYARAARLEA